MCVCVCVYVFVSAIYSIGLDQVFKIVGELRRATDKSGEASAVLDVLVSLFACTSVCSRVRVRARARVRVRVLVHACVF